MASRDDALRISRFRRHGGTWLAAAGGLVALLAVGTAVVGGREPTPAPPETLARIAERNQDAAIAAAARMKAESEASARATDARLDAADTAASR
jgi:hypothetical protein